MRLGDSKKALKLHAIRVCGQGGSSYKILGPILVILSMKKIMVAMVGKVSSELKLVSGLQIFFLEISPRSIVLNQT